MSGVKVTDKPAPKVSPPSSGPTVAAEMPPPLRAPEDLLVNEASPSLPQPEPVAPSPGEPTATVSELLRGQQPSPLTNGEIGPPVSAQALAALFASQKASVDSPVGATSVSAGESLRDTATRFDTTPDVLKELNPDLETLLRDGKFWEDSLIAVPLGDLPGGKRATPGRVWETGSKAYSTKAPNTKQVLAGDVAYRGMAGPSVVDLQKKLNAMGVKPALVLDGKFGPRTEAALKAFQKANGIQQTGVLGALSWNTLLDPKAARINPADLGGPSLPPEVLAQMAQGGAGAVLAQAAAAHAERLSCRGRCAFGVNNALTQLGLERNRGHAYQKAEQLAQNANFREVTVSPGSLRQLPAGAVVVWGRSAAKPYGHVSVALGNGQEASDHIQVQIEGGRYGTNFGNGPDPLGRQCRVFLPA